MTMALTISQEPIFVCGFPRSGTTYLQSLLCTQESLVSLPETHFFSVVTGWMSLEEKGGIGTVYLERALAKIEEYLYFSFSRESLDFLKQQASSFSLSKKTFFELLIHDFFKKKGIDLTKGDLRWLEKTPDHVRHLPILLKLYPKAKFIVIIRNPIEAIESVQTKLSHLNLQSDLLAQFWLEGMETTEHIIKTCPNSILPLHFAELQTNRTELIRRSTDFIGCDFNKSLLENYSEEAKKIVLPNEIWKSGNLQESVHKYSPQNKVLSPIDLKQVVDIIGMKMQEYNFAIPSCYENKQSK